MGWPWPVGLFRLVGFSNGELFGPLGFFGPNPRGLEPSLVGRTKLTTLIVGAN